MPMTRRQAKPSRILVTTLFVTTLFVPIATPASAAKGPFFYMKATVKIAPGADDSIAKPCPDGATTIGGGGQIKGSPPGAGITETYSATFGAGWTAGAENGSAKTVKLTSFGVCVFPIGLGLYGFFQTGALSAGTAASLISDCPSGMKVVGGGGVSDGGFVVGSAPADGGDGGTIPDDAWRVTGTNTSASTAALKVYYTCSDDLTPSYVSIADGVPAGDTLELDIGCPPGQLATGGGADISAVTSFTQLAATFPQKKGAGWSAAWNNGTASPGTLTTHVVCVVPPA